MASGTSTEYIKHHLQNLTFGKLPDGSLGLAQDPEQAKAMGFWAINLDTLGFAFLLGILFLFFFSRVAKSATANVPGGSQNAPPNASWRCAPRTRREQNGAPTREPCRPRFPPSPQEFGKPLASPDDSSAAVR